MPRIDLLGKIDDVVNFYLDDRGKKTESKVKRLLFHDPIHHTINFKDYERKILDNPFLQRLKHIRQMGLAYFVYADALHSRFGHSAGVAHLSSVILKNSFKKIKKSVLLETRIAGLLHDIGHGPFSHVSDRLVKDGLFSINKLFRIPTKYNSLIVEYNTKNFHELVGYLLIKTKRFQEYFEDLERNYNKLKQVPSNDFIASLIIGDFLGEYQDDGERCLATKIINGDMDADKIDYLLRDSAYTGLPVPIDYERLTFLFEKLEEGKGKTKRYELGVSEKGARSFDLLLRSKNLLFPTVYQHHTTRGCEGTLLTAIKVALENPIVYNMRKVSTPIDLLYFDDCSLMQFLSSHNNGIIKDAIRRLSNRSYYRVAFEIRYWFFKSRIDKLTNPSDQIKMTKELEKLYDIFEQSSIDHHFRIEIKKELLKSVKWKKKFPNISSINENMVIDYIIFFDYPDVATVKAYTEPYVKTVDPITKKCDRASLVNIGFDMPNRKQTLTARVYCLPEVREEISLAFKNYIKKNFPRIYNAGKIRLVS